VDGHWLGQHVHSHRINFQARQHAWPLHMSAYLVHVVAGTSRQLGRKSRVIRLSARWTKKRSLPATTITAPFSIYLILAHYLSGLPSTLVTCCPWTTKRDNACNTRGPSDNLKDSLNNTTHSGVGCYAPVAQTTLKPCMFLCLSISLGKP
jgi:hypothetical protein